MKFVFHFIGVLAITAPVWAGETVILVNGFQLHADRHETEGAVVRLYDEGGVREMPADSVISYEPDEVKPSLLPVVIPPRVIAAVAPAGPDDYATEAAKKFDLPESFVRSVMRAESGFQPNAVSPKGATGLMQLMPDTAKRLGVNLNDPRENAEGGAQYLRELLARYENNPDQVLLALAAYNAGPGSVERYHGVPPYRETREYILRVLKNWHDPPNK